MADENLARWEQEWLDKHTDADSIRSYRPVLGPDEPGEAPPGRASASASAGNKGDVGDQSTEHHPAGIDPDG